MKNKIFVFLIIIVNVFLIYKNYNQFNKNNDIIKKTEDNIENKVILSKYKDKLVLYKELKQESLGQDTKIKELETEILNLTNLVVDNENKLKGYE